MKISNLASDRIFRLRSTRRFNALWPIHVRGRFLMAKSGGRWYADSHMGCFTPKTTERFSSLA